MIKIKYSFGISACTAAFLFGREELQFTDVFSVSWKLFCFWQNSQKERKVWLVFVLSGCSAAMPGLLCQPEQMLFCKSLSCWCVQTCLYQPFSEWTKLNGLSHCLVFYRTIGAGRYLWRTSPATLLKQGQLEPVTQGHVHSRFHYLHGQGPHNHLWATCSSVQSNLATKQPFAMF